MLNFNTRMVSIFCSRSSISSKHVAFVLCPFLGPHLTTYHSNIGVHIIVVLELGTSTLEFQVYVTNDVPCIEVVCF